MSVARALGFLIEVPIGQVLSIETSFRTGHQNSFVSASRWRQP